MHVEKTIPDKPATDGTDKTSFAEATERSKEKAAFATSPVATMSADSEASVNSSASMSKDMQSNVPPEMPGKSASTPTTKMKIATEIFKRMRKSKGVTRKEIIDQFVVDAKLSKAGAATYYQLIKAKVK